MIYRMESVEKRLAKELVDAFGEISTTIIGDALGRFNCMSSIRHFNKPGIRLKGTAFTVKTSAGDNLMIHKAIHMAEPGDIIVIDGGGFENRALLGEIMSSIGQKKGLDGFVVDGAIRDPEEIKELGFPVYAKAATPAGPFREGPGQINVPIICAGAIVNPGDLIIGDDNGITVIPYERANNEVLQEAQRIEAMEKKQLEQIEAGTLNYDWIDETLMKKGVLGGTNV